MNEDAKSTILQVMQTEIHQMVQDFSKDAKEFDELWTKDTGGIGHIVKCHLMLEYYLTRFLKTAHPGIANWDELRLTFAHKIEMADHPASALTFLAPGLRCVNKIRNRIVHNLAATVAESDLEPLRTCLAAKHEVLGIKEIRGNALINDFATTACAMIASAEASIRRHAPETGIVGLQKWWQTQLERPLKATSSD